MKLFSYIAIAAYFFSSMASEQVLVMLFSVCVGLLALLVHELEVSDA